MQADYEADTQPTAFYVDCGLTYSGAPVTTVTGLSHLEGYTVSISADGSREVDQVVSGGSVTRFLPASLLPLSMWGCLIRVGQPRCRLRGRAGWIKPWTEEEGQGCLRQCLGYDGPDHKLGSQ
jgi:hypothetical protein